MNGTTFLNIDLDIESKNDISAIVNSFKKSVTVMRHEFLDEVFYGSFETGLMEPNKIIEEYTRLVENLNAEERLIWDQCSIKSLDIGFESGLFPNALHTTISPNSLNKLSSIGATFVITIYPYNKENT